MSMFLKAVPQQLPSKPKAILLISAHWEVSFLQYPLHCDRCVLMWPSVAAGLELCLS
jgi:aromatic ring-opening dioxygenase catalytic subunit (LigB family)